MHLAIITDPCVDSYSKSQKASIGMCSGCDYPYKTNLVRVVFGTFIWYHGSNVVCRDKFRPPPPPHRSICNIWIPGPYNIMDPPCILSTIAEIQKGEGLGSGYEWLAGLVSRVCIAGLVFRVCKGGLNISGVHGNIT